MLSENQNFPRTIRMCKLLETNDKSVKDGENGRAGIAYSLITTICLVVAKIRVHGSKPTHLAILAEKKK